jgi:RNA polymerase sigma-70 factor, ECF subfamily
MSKEETKNEIISDSDLVKLTLEDQNNFSYLIERYEGKLRRYIYRLTNISDEEAEDILQNIFIKVYLNINSFDGKLKFSSWIYRIAHNEIIDNFRRLKSRPQLIAVDISDSKLIGLANEIDLFEEVATTLKVEKIKKAISGLNLKYREILILRFLEEKDYQEIADIIKKPLGTVASRVNKAKKELQKSLQDKNI